MKSFIKSVLGKIPYFGRIYNQLDLQGMFPIGHYHSPIPLINDAIEYSSAHAAFDQIPSEIDFNHDSQYELLKQFQIYYDSQPFPKIKDGNFRYYFDQVWFSYADAIFLHCFLRHFQPNQIIEVGSGFSSAVILDTVDRFLPQKTKLTLIEPNPDRLNSIVKPDDRNHHNILSQNIQDVPLNLFKTLGANDFLFIDSSHVVKCGSDLQRIMFEVLPILPVGVVVHFHDVFSSFEYPIRWYKEGRFWNESYMLRSFLAYNESWNIRFFNDYVGRHLQEYLTEFMPLCLKNTGGSLYIQRVK